MRDLLVAVPSRGRPHNMRRLWKAWEATVQGDTHLMVGLDTDDPVREDYPPGPEYIVLPGGWRRVVGWINHIASLGVGTYRAIGHLGDDCVPRTPGWDTEIMKALEKTPMAFANDLEDSLREPGTLPCHPFMRSEMVSALGYFGPPVFQHLWVDVAWYAWGQAIGITYLPDVIIEHMHFLDGKAPRDVGYSLSRELNDRDYEALGEYQREGLEADIAKLKAISG